MPRMDGTGPRGQGAMTGRGLGICNGANAVRYGRGLGLGFRRGFERGLGRMFGRDFYFCSTASGSKKELLAEQKRILQQQLDAINDELDNL